MGVQPSATLIAIHHKEQFMSKDIKVQDDALRLNQDYKHFLTDIKTQLQTAQIRAALMGAVS